MSPIITDAVAPLPSLLPSVPWPTAITSLPLSPGNVAIAAFVGAAVIVVAAFVIHNVVVVGGWVIMWKHPSAPSGSLFHTVMTLEFFFPQEAERRRLRTLRRRASSQMVD